MSKKHLLFIFFASLFFCCKAQITNDGLGARGLAMSNATITNADVWSVNNNIAALADYNDSEVGVGFNNRFGVGGFNTISMVGAHHTDMFSAGLSVKRFGDNLYNESIIGIGGAHKIDFVSLGLKANILQVAIDELGSKTNVAFEFGGLVHINDEITIGANVFNINQAKMAAYNDERFSTVLKAGLTYKPTDKLSATIETEKDVEYKHTVKVGLEYFIIEKLAVRTGFSTLNYNASAGLGLILNKFNFDYAFSYHTLLGVSNGLSINYLIKKGEKNSEAENLLE